ncbi:hypothetical protein MTR67_052291 [Solanum verrucosum]|uniref:Uncharacterized protein n=1 Tax=Solanum verrucosum TaxID=315347 RepID=A0AAF1A0X1_SOLVR|nr:hypothetical protein MTR67_052291 [Solanum verrucosum]
MAHTHPQSFGCGHNLMSKSSKETLHLQQLQHSVGHMKHRIAHSRRQSNNTCTSQLIFIDIVQIIDVIIVPKISASELLSEAIEIGLADLFGVSPKHLFAHQVGFVDVLACWNFRRVEGPLGESPSGFDFDSFDIVYVNDIPQQPQGSVDYGVYISAYAEFLGNGNGIPADPFDPDLMLSRYVTLL